MLTPLPLEAFAGGRIANRNKAYKHIFAPAIDNGQEITLDFAIRKLALFNSDLATEAHLDPSDIFFATIKADNDGVEFLQPNNHIIILGTLAIKYLEAEQQKAIDQNLIQTAKDVKAAIFAIVNHLQNN
jgi:hypothetical protein